MALEKRGKNRWRITIMYKGDRYRIIFEGNKTAARKAQDEFAVQVRKGMAAGSTMSFNVFVNIFRESKYQALSPKTIYDYDNQINKRILPSLGRHNLDEIGPMHLKRYYRKLADEGAGERTIKKNHQILSSMFTEAVHLGYLNENPCKRIPAPKYRRAKQDNFLHAEEAAVLLEALETEPLSNAIVAYIALFTGARIGEICALTWSDIDMESRMLNINKSRLRIAGQGVVDKETKTEGSNRAVPFPKALAAKFRLLKRIQGEAALRLGEDYAFSGYVVTYINGQPTTPSNRSGWFRKFINRHDLKKVTLHGLRHTYATLLLHGNKMPGYAISGNLGHSDPTMLLRTYAHEIEESNRRAADYMDELFAK